MDVDGDNKVDGFLFVAGTGAANLASHLSGKPPYPDPTEHPDTVVTTAHPLPPPGDFLG